MKIFPPVLLDDMLSIDDERLNIKNKRARFRKLLTHKYCSCVRCGCCEIKDLRLVNPNDHRKQAGSLHHKISKRSMNYLISELPYEIVCVNCIRNLHP